MTKKRTYTSDLRDAMARRTARAFENLERAAERADRRMGHPSREPDPAPWEKPESPCGQEAEPLTGDSQWD